MQISIGIYVGSLNTKGGINTLIANFKTRVEADGGVFEAESCLTTFLNNLNNI